MLVKHLDVEADALFCGECVHVAADRNSLEYIIFGGTVLLSLGHHVVDEVGNSVPLEVLIAGARLDPDTDRDGADVLHLFGNEGQPVGQNFAADIARLFNHGKFPTSFQEKRPQAEAFAAIVTYPSRCARIHPCLAKSMTYTKNAQ